MGWVSENFACLVKGAHILDDLERSVSYVHIQIRERALQGWFEAWRQESTILGNRVARAKGMRVEEGLTTQLGIYISLPLDKVSTKRLDNPHGVSSPG